MPTLRVRVPRPDLTGDENEISVCSPKRFTVVLRKRREQRESSTDFSFQRCTTCNRVNGEGECECSVQLAESRVTEADLQFSLEEAELCGV
jgi:hypothetical protein